MFLPVIVPPLFHLSIFLPAVLSQREGVMEGGREGEEAAADVGRLCEC